jgi:hypothetical protein
VVTALGVLGIVIGLLGILANLAVAMYTIGDWQALKRYPGALAAVGVVWLRMTVIESLLLAALAACLSFGGIITLTGWPNAPRLLRSYALLKIPLSLLTDVTLGYVTLESFRYFAESRLREPPAFVVARNLIWAALSITFPVALLIVLRLQTVRRYYCSLVPNNGQHHVEQRSRDD